MKNTESIFFSWVQKRTSSLGRHTLGWWVGWWKECSSSSRLQTISQVKSELLAIVQCVLFFSLSFPMLLFLFYFWQKKKIERVLVLLHFDTSVNTLKYFAEWNSCCPPSPTISTTRFPQTPILPESLEILRLNDELRSHVLAEESRRIVPQTPVLWGSNTSGREAVSAWWNPSPRGLVLVDSLWIQSSNCSSKQQPCTTKHMGEVTERLW